MSDKQTMSTAQVAELFDVSTYTVRTWVREGKLTATKSDTGRWVFDRDEVMEMLNRKYGDDDKPVIGL